MVLGDRRGAQEILDWVLDFKKSKGRMPREDEIPFSRNYSYQEDGHQKHSRGMIEYHFGDYETLIEIAINHTKRTPFYRRSRKKRYCRNERCKKVLKRNRWYWCNDECKEAYLKEHNKVFTETELRELRKKVIPDVPEVLPRCKVCEESCKVVISHDTLPYKMVCKKSPDYLRAVQEVNRRKK